MRTSIKAIGLWPRKTLSYGSSRWRWHGDSDGHMEVMMTDVWDWREMGATTHSKYLGEDCDERDKKKNRYDVGRAETEALVRWRA